MTHAFRTYTTTTRQALAALASRLVRDEHGQGLAEYALILVFIAIVAIAALTLLGTNISTLLNSIATKV
jgi:pilus assembly protein Flp/PilA